MEFVIVGVIIFVWAMMSNKPKTLTEERVLKAIQTDEDNWDSEPTPVKHTSQSSYTSPMSLGHALDIVRAWTIEHPRFEQAALMVMESEGLSNSELWEKYHNYTYSGGY